MRFSIAAKIFGVTLLLVLVMVAAAAASMLLVRQVTEELTIVEGAYLPLARAVSAVESAAHEQATHFERAVSKLGGARPGSPEDAIEGFVAVGRSLDDEVRVALETLRAAAARARNVDHRIALVRLEGKLERLEHEHQDIEDEGLRVLELLREGRAEVSDALLARMEREQREFDLAAHEIAAAGADLSRSATASALASERRVLQINGLLTVLAAVLGLLLSLVIVRGLTRPVRDLLAATSEIERGNLRVEVPVLTRDELGELGRAFNHMAGELQVKEQIKETFGRYVDPRVVESLIDKAGTAIGSGDREVYTVFFSDIVGFTSIAERLTPGAVVKLINAYLTAMSAPLRESGGIIDKYIGDAIMAYWGPPFTSAEEHARLACGAALRQHALLDEFQAQVPELTGLRRDFPRVAIRIGIATGDVVVGSIGSDVARNFTVMGDTVNLGSRLEGLNKAYGTRILVSEQTHRDAGAGFIFREIDQVAVMGKDEPVRVFELMATAGDIVRERLADAFQAGLVAYRARRWDEAETAFQQCLDIEPADGPTQVYLDRVERLRIDVPPASWDGVWHAQSK